MLFGKKKTHHGIPEGAATAVIEGLGIDEHTDEDCTVSEVLSRHLDDAPVLASGKYVFIWRGNRWNRYVLPAGARRRILVGNPGEVELLTP